MSLHTRLWSSRSALIAITTLNIIASVLLFIFSQPSAGDSSPLPSASETANDAKANSLADRARNRTVPRSRVSSALPAPEGMVSIPIDLAGPWLEMASADHGRLLWPTDLVGRSDQLLSGLGVDGQTSDAVRTRLSHWEATYKKLQKDRLEIVDNSRGDPICRVSLQADELSNFADGLEGDLSSVLGVERAKQLRTWLIGDIGQSDVAEAFNFRLELTETDQILSIYSGDGERLQATRNTPIGVGGKVHAMIPHLIPPESAPDVLVDEPVPIKPERHLHPSSSG